MKQTITTQFAGQEYGVRADWAQASCPVEFMTGYGDWITLQYQVADFRHHPQDALRNSIEQAIEAGGDSPDDFRKDIELAIYQAKEVTDQEKE